MGLSSKEVNLVHKYFNEPRQRKSGVFRMTARYSRFKDIIASEYGTCYELALSRIKEMGIFRIK